MAVMFVFDSPKSQVFYERLWANANYSLKQVRADYEHALFEWRTTPMQCGDATCRLLMDEISRYAHLINKLERFLSHDITFQKEVE